MQYLIYLVQFIGIIIPLAGIVGLLRRRRQSNNSMHLMVTNMGCLLMNGGYLLVLGADTAGEALLISKMEYLGNSLFYYFFVLFLVSYLWDKYPKWPFYMWAFFESAGVFLYWNDALRERLLGDHLFVGLEESALLHLNIYTTYLDSNIVYMVRYSGISLALFGLLLVSNFRLFRMKEQADRWNMARLAGAQFVIMVSLIARMSTEPAFDFVPILAALSILSIILSVLSDEFYGITEMGHEWVFEQITDAFFIVDKNYGYLDANSYAREICPELNGLKKHRRIPEALYSLFVSGEEILELDGGYYKRKIIDIQDKNKTAGYSLLLLDVTRQQELMEQVRQEKERAEQERERADAANQAKSAFVSNVSHEIRTPMNAIVGMTQILLRNELPKQERDYILNIQNSGNALLTIINDILDMSKIESGKMELVEEDYDFMAMLGDLGMIILNRIGNKPVELIYDIDPAMPKKLYGDSLRIRQIIINLMNNATKFTEQGSVTLSVSVDKVSGDDAELAISVKDTGQGIREEDLPKLFGSFQQVDTKKNHKKEGTGLGLSISKQLVELMHGSIGVRSEYGKGSEFYFTIHQKITGQQKAAALKAEAKASVIAGSMQNEAAEAALQKLAENYQLSFIHDVLTDKVNNAPFYYFTDSYDLLSEEEKELLRGKGAVVYYLQNPMLESGAPADIEIINKPLYTYNFCQALNREAEDQTKERREASPVSFTAPTARILIVDDNEINRMVAEELISPLQLQVDTVQNGAEALKKVQEVKYDIVLMDHFMPVMDGIEAAMEIRKLQGEYYQSLPILALTANDAKDQLEKYLQAGMNDFIAKPIIMEDIFAKLKKWLPKEKIN